MLLQLVSKPDTKRCTSKDTGPKGGGLGGPTSIEEGIECQRRRCASKGGGL